MFQLSPPFQPIVREAWILAGVLDATVCYPRLYDDIGGIPHGLRLVCDLAHSNIQRIVIVWTADGPPPDVSNLANDPRFAGRATLEVTRTPPAGPVDDTILVVRADRLFHRDIPKLVLAAHRAGAIAKIAGATNDAVFAADRATAHTLATAAHHAHGIARHLRAAIVVEAPLPYAGFTARASNARALRRAEKQLVWSLRKSADGIVAKALHRPLSLRISWALCRTRIHPNHVTLTALALALAGGAIIATGGYAAAVIGMLFVDTGSIIDGVDGELARLRFQFSRTGQWLDTTVDDLANVAYISGAIANLTAAGTTWAIPVGTVALCAFALTQGTQYALIKLVYKSGDLAAIPWAFQSSESLSRTGLLATLPKLLKRDFVVKLFLVLAILDRLDIVLVAWAAGAAIFFTVFFIQLARNARRLAPHSA